MREGRVRRGHVPAGEGAGANLDVVLGVVEGPVVADTEGEELQQLTAIVLVEVGLVGLGVVQVVHHAGVLRQPEQQVVELAHAVLPEHIDHDAHFLAGVYLAVAGAENHVPEQGHLFLELVGVVDHLVHPELGVDFDGARFVIGRVVAHQDVILDAALGVQQFLDHVVVALRCLGLDLIPARPESGAAHQVSYQCNVLVSHILLLFLAFSLVFP